MPTGHLRIRGASNADYFATRLLAPFSRHYPGTTLWPDVTKRDTLFDQPVVNDTDLMIEGEPLEGLDLDPAPFIENSLVISTPRYHPLAGRHDMPLVRLRDEAFVAREQQFVIRIAIARFGEERGIRLQTRTKMTSNSAMKQAVEVRRGLGNVSLQPLETEPEAGRLLMLDVEGFPIEPYRCGVTDAGRRLPPVAQASCDFLMGDDAAQPMQPMQPMQPGRTP